MLGTKVRASAEQDHVSGRLVRASQFVQKHFLVMK